MYAQGRSLGRQLSIWMPALKKLASQNPGRVWLMGRDCDVFHQALIEAGCKVGYITGLNRDNARRLASRRKIERWLRSIGVRNGDILVDSGYSGSIFRRIAERTNLELVFVLLTTNPEGATGVPLAGELDTEKNRRCILALEHSLKREVVGWNAERRRPVVTKRPGEDGQRANRFFRGCVDALKDAIM